jgi:hypothetical protein
MESNTNSSPVSRLISVLLFFAGLVGIYYLYDYLFGPKAFNSYVLNDKVMRADINVTDPIIIASNKMPPLYEGGEFSVSAWIYINNWSYLQGYAKCILRIGGESFDTIRINLGGFKPKLMVRLHTRDANADTTTVINGPDNPQTDSLAKQTRNLTYGIQQLEGGLLELPNTSSCDLPEIDLQRWVNIVVAVNGKTVDVYLDGKLSRSCVLPNYFKVDSSYSGYLLTPGIAAANGPPGAGFGGQLGNVIMYDSALNPEVVYKNYIAGPEQITGFWQWFTSFFDIGVDVTVSSESKK